MYEALRFSLNNDRNDLKENSFLVRMDIQCGLYGIKRSKKEDENKENSICFDINGNIDGV